MRTYSPWTALVLLSAVALCGGDGGGGETVVLEAKTLGLKIRGTVGLSHPGGRPFHSFRYDSPPKK